MNPARLLAPAIVALLLPAFGAAAQSLGSYSVVRETVPMSSSLSKSLTVPCPEGTEVLSGGYRVLGFPTVGTRPEANRPTEDGTGWTARVIWNSLVSWGLEVTAVCGVVENRVQISATASTLPVNGRTLAVDCDGETRALGGGAEVSGELGNVYLGSWGVQGIFDNASTFASTNDSGSWSLTVYLICGNVPGYEIEFDDLQGNQSIRNLEAVCAPDRVPIGGGLASGQLQLADAAFTESTLSLDGQGWLASIRDFGSTAFWTASAIAVCAPEPGATVLGPSALAAVALLGARRARERDRAAHAESASTSSAV